MILTSETAAKDSSPSRSPYDVIIVGGGMAGLTACAYASRAGLRVLLCEKEQALGGLVRSFRREGFTWDAGIRAMEDSGIVLPMLEDLGIEVEFVPSPVSLGIADRIIPVESEANLEDYRQLLEHFFPEHREDIGRILDVVRRVMKQMDVLYGIENPAFKDLKRDREYVFGELLPWLGKFLLTIGQINRMSMPIDEYLRSLSRSPALIDIISQHFFRKTPSFFALSYFRLYLDYMYPVGGTGTLPQALASYCRSRGAEIRIGSRIVDVDPLAHSVRTEDGTVFGYRHLLWAADLKTLYQLVDISRLPRRRVRSRVQQRAELVRGARGGESVFTLYLGADLEPAWFSAKSNGHLFYTASRRGIGPEHHAKLEALLGANATGFEQLRGWIEHYVGHTTYEISIPVLKDPSLAPAGQTGLIISVLFDHALWATAQLRGWYDELKLLTEDGLLDALEASVFPGIRKAVTTRFSSTPATIADAVGTSDGAITGWAFTNREMPAVRKMQHVARSVVTPLPNISQAGQWAYSPSGLPIAILTGKLAADRMIKELRSRARAR